MNLPLLRLASLVLIGLAAFANRPSAAQGTPSPSCEAPSELIQSEPRLPETARRLAAKEKLMIVAIGSGSTAGAAAGGGDHAYPHRLEEALRRRYPGVEITVLNKGVARQTTGQMVDRFDQDVFPAIPTLVIWETGTAEAVRGADVDDFAQALQSGVAALRDRRIEVMLMDMQYSPDTASVINFEPYLGALGEVGAAEGVPVFRRYDVMKYWSDNDIFSFTDIAKEARAALAERVYACLGERLADAIAYAAR
jgi:acyl-CoA thioesterase I